MDVTVQHPRLKGRQLPDGGVAPVTIVQAYACAGVHVSKCTYVHPNECDKAEIGASQRCTGVHMHMRTLVQLSK